MADYFCNSRYCFVPVSEIEGPTAIAAAAMVLQVGIGFMAALLLTQLSTCPQFGTAPALVLKTGHDGNFTAAGIHLESQWVSPGVFDSQPDWTQQAVPDCTSSCDLGVVGQCDDAGEGAASDLCPLGSHSTDCGCRTGETVAEWLPETGSLAGSPQDFPSFCNHANRAGCGWSDRKAACGSAALVVPLLILYGCMSCLSCVVIASLLLAMNQECGEPAAPRDENRRP